MRVHGFQFPWHPLQILAWIIKIIYSGGYFVWYISVLPLPASITLGAIIGALLISLYICTFIVSIVNPADTLNKVRPDSELFCHICKITV